MPTTASVAFIPPQGLSDLRNLALHGIGEPIYDRSSIKGVARMPIYAEPPAFVVDLLVPYAHGGKNGLFGGAGVGTERTKQSWTKKWILSLVKLGTFSVWQYVTVSSCFYCSDGKTHIDTPFSHLLCKPSIMVARMTPPQSRQALFLPSWKRIHVDLAGGGHYSQAALRAKVAEIQTKISPSIGLTLNALYINPRQFSFQLPLWQDMRREGLPIEGFCVVASIPTTEKADEIIDGLKSVGIRHVAFNQVP